MIELPDKELEPPLICSNCDRNAVCPGGNVVSPKAGYYRSSVKTDYI